VSTIIPDGTLRDAYASPDMRAPIGGVIFGDPRAGSWTPAPEANGSAAWTPGTAKPPD